VVLLLVDRVADGLMVTCYDGWNDRERERESEDGRNWVLEGGFLADFGPKISPPLDHENQIYL
jgi:hypothetical protein